MAAISGPDLTLLRQPVDQQKATEYLVSFGFDVVWQARVNDASPTRGMLAIDYDTGAAQGDFAFADILKDIEVWFSGSTFSQWDRGKRRFLGFAGGSTVTSGTMYVDWHDDIELSDNDYITVVHHYPPWPRFAWFEESTSTFTKDGPNVTGVGETYTDQNEEPPPLPILSLPGITWDGAAITVSAAESRAVATGASISTYAWSVTPSGASGGTFASSSSATTTFTPNSSTRYRYVLHCTITDSNGNSSVGHSILISDRTSTPFGTREFKRSDIVERKDSQVAPLTLTLTSPNLVERDDLIRPDTSYADFADGALILIFSEDYYAGTQTEISFRSGSRYTDRLNLAYVGYVAAVEENWSDVPSVTLRTRSRLSELYMYSLSLDGVQATATFDWYKMLSDYMSVAPLLFHLFYYQTTVLGIMNLIADWTDTSKRSGVTLWTEGDVYRRAQALAGRNGRLMIVTETAQGELWVEMPAQLMTQSERNALTTVMTLDPRDAVTGVKVRRDLVAKVSQITVEGGSSLGYLGSWTPFISESVNVRTAGGITTQTLRGLVVDDQDDLNYRCGRLQAEANRRLKEIDVRFTGIYRGVFSPAQQEWTNTGSTLFASTQPGWLTSNYYPALANVRLVPVRVSHSHDNETGETSTLVTFEVEAPEGLTGRTVPIPVLTPGYVGASTPPPVGAVLPPVPNEVLVTGDLTNGVEIYDPDGASWEARNGALTTNGKKVHRVRVSPYWHLLAGSADPEDAILWIATEDGVWTSPDFGKTWFDRTPIASAFTNLPAGVDSHDLVWFDVDVYATNTNIDANIAAGARYDNSGTWLTWLCISTDRGNTWTVVQEQSDGGSDEVKGLRFQWDKTTGAQLFVAYWNDTDDKLWVGKRDTALAAVGSDEDFAACTEAELDAETYLLEVRTFRDPSVTNGDEFVLAYGDTQKT